MNGPNDMMHGLTYAELVVEHDRALAEIKRLRHDIDAYAKADTEHLGEVERLLKLAKAYEKYIDLLSASEASMIALAVAHGWKCPDDTIKRGEELRTAIRALKEKP